MSGSETERYTLTWRIQNFSMCPQKLGECLQSPVFYACNMRQQKWRLDLYPRGREKENTLSCFLQCMEDGDPANAPIGFAITAFSLDATKRITEVGEYEFHHPRQYHGFSEFVPRDLIFNHKDVFLPNDTFTLKCCLSEAENHPKDNTIFVGEYGLQMATIANREDMEASFIRLCDIYSITSRVVVQRKTISWPIHRFSSLSPNKRLTIPIFSLLEKKILYVTFYVINQCAQIEIVDFIHSKNTYVKCKISVLNALRSVEYFAEDEHLFESGVKSDVWKFPSFIKLSKLEEDGYLKLTNDFLYIRIDMAYSELERVHHAENNCPIELESIVKNVHNSFGELGNQYRDEELSDVTLRAGGRAFNVHKIILKVRSPVFSSMFHSEMKERNTGVVDIADVDSETMDRMLAFFYTDTVGDLHAADAALLYSAADKYQVSTLKFRCALVLIRNLSLENVCEILTLADVHQDDYLKECVENFISFDSAVILTSQEWKDFIKSNGSLAATVMLKMLTVP